MRGSAFLVTGTDTGIGKTTVTCALAAGLAEQGKRVGVAKPFETGCLAGADGVLQPADACLLRFFSGCEEPLDVICPHRAAEPLAPAVAFARAGHAPDLDRLRTTIAGIAARHDITFVEGAGGLLVPACGDATFADLARDWRMPLLLVVGNRLGALNHALLTIERIHSARLSLAGYVINTLSPEKTAATQTNVEVLRARVGAPLGVLPWLGRIEATVAGRRRLAKCALREIDTASLTNAVVGSRA